MVTAALAESLVADEPAIADAPAAGAASTPTTTTPPSSWPTYLLQFIHRYLDMREAEAQACAALGGVPRDALPLEMPPAAEAALSSHPAEGEEQLLQREERKNNSSKNGGATFRTVRLPGPEAAAEILRRSMLVRCILDVWGEGDSMESLCEDLKSKGAAERAKQLFKRREEESNGEPLTWRLSVDGFGLNMGTQATTLEACKRLSFLEMPGRVSLDDPDFVLRLIVIGGEKEGEVEEEEVGEGEKSKRQQEQQSHHQALLGPSPSPRRYVLGLEVGTRIRHPKNKKGGGWNEGQQTQRKSKKEHHRRDRSRVLRELSLQKRPYIGPTSMDAEVAAIMCNLALVKKGSVVFDPCVGTGSILVAAAAAGAHVVGADIDLFALVGRPAARAVRPQKNAASASAAKFAKGKEGRAAAAAAVAGASVGLLDNFDAYELPRPAGVLVADMSRLPFRKRKSNSPSSSSSSSGFCFEGAFDAIIADPPYGVRAGGRKQAATAEGGGAEEEEEDVGGGNVDDGDKPSPPPSTTSSAPTARRPRGPARANARFRAEGAPAPTTSYDLGECLWDLLRLAASSLSVGGRLVFFLPSRPGAGPEALPKHPCLRAVSDCEQPLSRWYCRRLVTMEKWRSYEGAGGEEAESAARENEGNAVAFAAASAVASGVYGEYASAEVAAADDDAEEEEENEDGEGKKQRKKKKKKGSRLGALKGRGKRV